MQLEPGFESIFDGETLTGWRSGPRHYGSIYVEDGAIVGGRVRRGRAMAAT